MKQSRETVDWATTTRGVIARQIVPPGWNSEEKKEPARGNVRAPSNWLASANESARE